MINRELRAREAQIHSTELAYTGIVAGKVPAWGIPFCDAVWYRRWIEAYARSRNIAKALV
jgi:hypothetical protein